MNFLIQLLKLNIEENDLNKIITKEDEKVMKIHLTKNKQIDKQKTHIQVQMDCHQNSTRLLKNNYNQTLRKLLKTETEGAVPIFLRNHY